MPPLMHVSTLFVVILLAWLAVRRWLPRRRAIQRSLLAALVLPAVLIYPFSNNLLSAWVEYEFDPALPCLATPPTAIVVLPAGIRHQPTGIGPWSRMLPTTAVRVMEGVSLAHRYPRAKLIFAGRSREASAFQRAMAGGGLIDEQRLLIDQQSASTALAAERISKLLEQAELKSAWLVTSALHMRRALGAFRHAGATVCPYPVDFTAQPGPRPWWLFPPPQGLERADRLAHELLGLLWYWLTDRI